MITPDDLLNVKILKDLPEEHLAALLPHLIEKKVSVGTTIIFRGDPGTSMYMVADGTVVVTLINDEGIEYSIATIGAGDIFGEMSLMTGEPRTANVKSLSTVRLFELSQKSFFELVAAYPALNESILRILVQRRSKTAIHQQSAGSQRKGNIATLFAQPPPDVKQLAGKTKWSESTNEEITRLAADTGNVLIYGERGSGKDLTARLIHYSGPEGKQPLYHLNCASPPPVQRVSEAETTKGDDALHREIAQRSALFGHGADAGSFAQGLRRGYLELADNGALVLENIETLTSRVQRLLVEYIENGSFVRAGETEPIASRVRLLATTSTQPDELGQQGKLDPRLLMHVGVATLLLKPLRERKKDIPILAEHFLREYNHKFSKNVSGFSSGALNLLVDHDWPMNIEELHQVVERAVAVATGETIEETQVFLNIPTFSATGKYNLLRNQSFRKLAIHPFFPTGLRFITIPFILALIVFTLIGPPDKNPANLIVWAAWWPFLIFSIIISGRAWCGYCPLPIISDRINCFRRKALPIPSFLAKNGVWIGFIGFAVILLSEHASHMFTTAHATSVLLITILAGTIITNFFFGKRSWCKHICPLGKMVSHTTPLSFIELDSNSTVCSSQCQTHDCVKDESCPMGLHPSAVASSNDCILCLSCVKRCKHQAVRINARNPWKELLVKKQWDIAGAFFAIFLAALVLAIKIPSWPLIYKLISSRFSENLMLADVTLAVTIGLTFSILTLFASGFPKSDTWKQNFAISGYAYLSLSFVGFFNVYFHEFVYRGQNLFPWISAQVGLNNTIPAEMITPNLGTLKALIPIITLLGATASIIMLAKLAKKNSLPAYALRAHRVILLATTCIFLLIL